MEPLTTPQFSIVIASLNRAPLLARCLDSVFGQNFTDVEVIVVDGGSTDGTAAVLQKYGSRVRTFQESGGGPGGARNIGVDHARGQFVVFVDSDDILLDGALALYAEVMTAVPNVKMLLAEFHEFSSESELAAVSGPGLDYIQYADYLGAAEAGYLSGTHRLVIDRATFLAAEGLRPQLKVCEDQDFGLRNGEAGPCVVIRSPATVGYRRHPGNISGNSGTFAFGVRWMIDCEKRGVYPGGTQRREQRRAIITRSARSTSVACINAGLVAEGLDLYRATFAWHVQAFRIKYLAGLPLMAAAALVRGR